MSFSWLLCTTFSRWTILTFRMASDNVHYILFGLLFTNATHNCCKSCWNRCCNLKHRPNDLKHRSDDKQLVVTMRIASTTNCCKSSDTVAATVTAKNCCNSSATTAAKSCCNCCCNCRCNSFCNYYNSCCTYSNNLRAKWSRYN